MKVLWFLVILISIFAQLSFACKTADDCDKGKICFNGTCVRLLKYSNKQSQDNK